MIIEVNMNEEKQKKYYKCVPVLISVYAKASVNIKKMDFLSFHKIFQINFKN